MADKFFLAYQLTISVPACFVKPLPLHWRPLIWFFIASAALTHVKNHTSLVCVVLKANGWQLGRRPIGVLLTMFTR